MKTATIFPEKSNMIFRWVLMFLKFELVKNLKIIVPWREKSPCENANPRAKTKNDVFKSGQFMKEKKKCPALWGKKIKQKKKVPLTQLQQSLK